MRINIHSLRNIVGLGAVGSTEDRVRTGLVAVGSAFGTVFSIAAFIVLTIDGYDDRFTNNLLKEPGLRPGVAVACWLLLIPVLIFIGLCTRVCADRRERRYAAIRLAGGTASQIRVIASAETGLATLVGSAFGLCVVLAGRAILASRVPPDGRLVLPVVGAFPWLAVILFCLVIPIVTGCAAALALRGVTISPLGIARRHRRTPPKGWPALLLIVGPLAVLVGIGVTDQGTGGSPLPLLVTGVAITVLGLMLASAWLSANTGRLLARSTRWPSLLIAGRRLEANPWGQSWAMSSVVVCAFFAAGTAFIKQEAERVGSNDPFFDRAFQLVNLAILLAAVVALAGLVVSLAESILERRRSMAAMVASGVSMSTLRWTLLLQAILPLIPALVVSITLGGALVVSLTHASDSNRPAALHIPGVDLVVIGLAAVAVTAVSSFLATPFLQRSVRPSELRFE